MAKRAISCRSRRASPAEDADVEVEESPSVSGPVKRIAKKAITPSTNGRKGTIKGTNKQPRVRNQQQPPFDDPRAAGALRRKARPVSRIGYGAAAFLP